ncbi:hypothetical protein PENFLA_c016G05195 [Penicillium flavigenum]|uniref:Uncharacterized protein n=1 Tax=Penicillium flavigenum TaxID=254877 RepID=A0A1V6T395_9EURO|nr:hypothetical protein PENFLA_c016G05195 [Penicillium flavigenum]
MSPLNCSKAWMSWISWSRIFRATNGRPMVIHVNGETLRIANIGHVQNELRTIHGLAPRRVITLDLNAEHTAEHTAEALVEGSSACVWVGWESETGHIT